VWCRLHAVSHPNRHPLPCGGRSCDAQRRARVRKRYYRTGCRRRCMAGKQLPRATRCWVPFPPPSPALDRRSITDSWRLHLHQVNPSWRFGRPRPPALRWPPHQPASPSGMVTPELNTEQSIGRTVDGNVDDEIVVHNQADIALRRQGPVASDEVAVAPGGVQVGSARRVAGAVGRGQTRYALSTAASSAHCAEFIRAGRGGVPWQRQRRSGAWGGMTR